MAEFLLFTLYGPLAAWGEIAVGERRASFDRPGKSAAIGLVAAALGVERADAPAHRALHDGYGFAVRIDAPGQPLRDYHTAQVPPARKGRAFATRREELAAPDLGTVLSTRDYLTDAAYSVALWPRAVAPHTLAELAAALARPRFVLYLGRRACPPGLPLAPDVVEAVDLLAAFAGRPAYTEALANLDGEGRVRPFRRLLAADMARVRVYFDTDAPGLAPADYERVGRRRDGIGDRSRWQFEERSEGTCTVEGGGAA